jgi:acyl transferase domain-containing protein/NAD(P)-dependent dehydrogenase (short-subunit alcohol dehydrogenase family)/acyl carrier protein
MFPGAENLGAYWALIKDGIDAITDVPPTHWRTEDYYDPDPKAPDRIYAARGGFLHPIDFNPAEFGIAPNSLEATDTAQLLALVAAREALRDAGYSPFPLPHSPLGLRPFDRSRVSVILGVTGTLELVIPLGARLGHPHWRRALREAGVADDVANDVVQRIADSYVDWQENSFPGLLGNVVAGRIANRFDLGGTNCVVDAACASSLSALHLATLELASGRSDMVITGGVDTFNDIFMYMCFSKTPALSPTGSARPFDASADGTVLGEGLGLVVLKRLTDAQRDGDRIYAVLRGVGTASDGKGNAIYAPRAGGQVEALRAAYRVAGVEPESIDLVEAHGTGTHVGDATEVDALCEVYQAKGRREPWCALGSVKSQIGHTKAAAGVAGLIKTVLALYHKVLPPTIKVQLPLESLAGGQTPFYVNTEKRPWLPTEGQPRRAAVSAFGFGGSNFHCVVEEAHPDKTSIDWDDVEILPFSADTPALLQEKLRDWPRDLRWEELRRHAAQARQAWQPGGPCRLLVVLQKDHTDLGRLLANAGELLGKDPQKTTWRSPEGVFYGYGPPAGGLAVLFPGQGAQYPGMLRDLACHFPACQETLRHANRLYSEQDAAQRLSDLIYPIPSFTPQERAAKEAALRATEVAQPALGAVSLGAWRVLESFGVRSDFFAGHSYGELTALCAAGCLESGAFHSLSILRGRLMAEEAQATGRGTMLAVQAAAVTIAAILREEGLDLVLANKNSPRQTVLSGPTAAIEKAQKAFATRQVRTTRLDVAAAFHGPLVAQAEPPFRAALEKIPFRRFRVPIFANSTARPYPEESAAARDLLAGQLARPVEFVAIIDHLYEAGARSFLEVGPGPRLTGLVSEILQGRDHQAFALDGSAGKRSGFVDLACCLAWLAAQGLKVQLAAWGGSRQPPAGPAEPKKPTLVVPLSGANYVKPRPERPTVRSVNRSNPPAASNGAPTPKMNGSTGHREPALAAQEASPPSTRPLPLPELTPADDTALAQALQITRDSLGALQKMQEQTAQLHRQFLEGQESAQRTVHLLVEQQQRLLQTSLGLAPLGAPTVPSPAPVRELPLPASLAVSIPPPVVAQPEPAPVAPAANGRVETILLEVIAEKTGYPTEMLDLNMALDADLGIDSIKRVEILSALQERLPQAPTVKPEHLGTLHNLRQIADFLAGAPSAAPPRANGVEQPPLEKPPGVDAYRLSLEGVQSVLLEIIAEKTGYPVEMVDLDMALDADLGIDSIKRVEILSALQERLPQAPTVKPEHLGTLHNLRQIADFLAGAPTKPTRGPSREQPEPYVPRSPRSPALQRGILQTSPLADAPRERITLPTGSEIWIVGDDSDMIRTLEESLGQRGFRIRRMSYSTLRGTAPSALGGLLFLAPKEEVRDGLLCEALLGLRHAASSLRAASRAGGTLFVTVSHLDGCFGLGELDSEREPIDGGLAGLAKTAQREWPEVPCKAIDLSPQLSVEQAASAILEEMFLAGPLEVGVSLAGRCTLDTVVQPFERHGEAKPLEPGDVVIVSGGARGVTAEVAVALAQAFRPTLVLLGRSPEPQPEPAWLAPLQSEADIKRELGSRANGNASLKRISEEYQALTTQREIRTTLNRLQGIGVCALYRSVDVRDVRAVAALLASLSQELGPVRGLVHGAGVLADARIEDKTAEQFDRVYRTKVDGLRSLLGGLDSGQLRTLVLFSSSTGRYGRAGQADYAMANEVLNKLAQQQARRLPSCRVVSVNWGPWEGGMVTPALAGLFQREGIGLIPLQAGAQFLVEELTQPAKGAIEVVVLGAAPIGNADKSHPVDPLSSATTPSASAAAHTPMPIPPAALAKLPVAFERSLDLAGHPILDAHVLDGRPVLPVVLMLEWLAHAAMHQNPGLAFHGCDDLRVLHGVALENETVPLLRVCAGKAVKREGFFRVPVEMRSLQPDGREVLHARAEVLLTTQLPPAPPAAMPRATRAYPRTPAEFYPDCTFHGPELQGIERVDCCDEGGLDGVVRTAPSPAAWIRQPLRQKWLTDPLVLDSSFQMMILWTLDQRGAPCLPCHLTHYRQYQRGFPAGQVHVLIHVTRTSDLQALADLDYVDRDGQLIARLEGYECVLDPTLVRAFHRNRPASPARS